MTDASTDAGTTTLSAPPDQDGPGLRVLDLLQVVDRSFPTGAFVHSAGLEWLVTHPGFDLATTLRLRLREQLGRLDLVFLLHAYAGDPFALDSAYHARLLPRESREASMQVGRQLVVSAADLFDDPALHSFAHRAVHAHVPIAFGLVARVLRCPPPLAAETYAFHVIRGQVSAAQRLTRLGQTQAQRLIHSLKPAIQETTMLALNTPLDDSGGFAPIFDIAAMAHERQTVRLFVS